MKLLALLILTLLSTGCATMYGPMSSQGGYEDKRMQEGVYYVHFTANAHTSVDKTTEFLWKRAGEVCSQDGYGYFYPAAFANATSQSVSHRTSTYVSPTYSSGTAYAYGGRGYATGGWNGSTYGGNAYSTSYDVVDTYPNLEAIVVCFKDAERPAMGVQLKPVKPEVMSENGVKDGLPGFVVERQAEESDGIKVQTGDIIVKVEGTRVQDMVSLMLALRKVGLDKTSLNVDVIREGKPLTIETIPLKLTNNPAVDSRQPASDH